MGMYWYRFLRRQMGNQLHLEISLKVHPPFGTSLDYGRTLLEQRHLWKRYPKPSLIQISFVAVSAVLIIVLLRRRRLWISLPIACLLASSCRQFRVQALHPPVQSTVYPNFIISSTTELSWMNWSIRFMRRSRGITIDGYSLMQRLIIPHVLWSRSGQHNETGMKNHDPVGSNESNLI